jgi:hypothetical protein
MVTCLFILIYSRDRLNLSTSRSARRGRSRRNAVDEGTELLRCQRGLLPEALNLVAEKKTTVATLPGSNGSALLGPACRGATPPKPVETVVPRAQV